MKAEPTLAIWTLVVFLVLLAILTKFAWKPLMHALHEREKHLEHVLHETKRARNESETLLSEHRKQMARAADEVSRAARTGAARRRSDRRKDRQAAQTEAESAKQRATRDIGAARDRPWLRSGRKRPIWRSRSPAACVQGTDRDDHRRLLNSAMPNARGPRVPTGTEEKPDAWLKGAEVHEAQARSIRIRPKVGCRYAEALIHAAEHEGAVDQVLDELDELECDVSETQPAVRPDPGVATGFLRPRKTAF